MMPFTSLKGKIFRISLSLAVIAMACNKNGPKSIDYQTATVTYVLANSANATLFKAAVTRAGLDSTLAGTGPFTIFVPTDDAMNQSGISAATIDTMSVNTARALVLYHTVAGLALGSSDLIDKSEWKLVTANGDSVFISSDSNTIYVSGAQVAAVDLVAANGILHAAGSVLTPPKQTLAQAIATDTSLTFMQAAIQHASAVPDSLGTRLSGGSVYSVFAPDNDAFRALGYQRPSDLDTANSDSLRHLLLAHFIPQRLMSYDITDQSQHVNANDSVVDFAVIGLTTTLRLNSSDSLSTVTVVSADNRAYNGVLFKVANVLR